MIAALAMRFWRPLAIVALVGGAVAWHWWVTAGLERERDAARREALEMQRQVAALEQVIGRQNAAVDQLAGRCLAEEGAADARALRALAREPAPVGASPAEANAWLGRER